MLVVEEKRYGEPTKADHAIEDHIDVFNSQVDKSTIGEGKPHILGPLTKGTKDIAPQVLQGPRNMIKRGRK